MRMTNRQYAAIREAKRRRAAEQAAEDEARAADRVAMLCFCASCRSQDANVDIEVAP